MVIQTEQICFYFFYTGSFRFKILFNKKILLKKNGLESTNLTQFFTLKRRKQPWKGKQLKVSEKAPTPGLR